MGNYGNYLGKETGKLGFGLMRLPKLPDDPSKIDVETVKTMVDLFMAAGLTYFDTAYVYDGGESEIAARKALVERYPRDSFTLATKMNAWLGHPSEEEVKNQLETSLERTGAGYFDYYLLHAVQENNYKIYDDYGIWDFVKSMKEAGKIRHWGFSFHASPELLDRLLTEHPDAEFVQLQVNYADWDNPSVQSRGIVEVAQKHGKPFVVMEPVKGGTLADPPESVAAIFREASPDMSVASWAIRFAASQEGCLTVLSGMSTIDQMKDNLSYMKDFHPLDEADLAVIKKAQTALDALDLIKCTGCHYCMDGCPVSMHIPDIFSAMNKKLLNDQTGAARSYEFATRDGARPSDCVACGQCEGACPQTLPIISLLERCKEAFE
ncbi:MAG: aldo/keto reductase [Blautia sp.]|nr:aldo/keto reductase [Blautia sp.]